jgi:hypothetical protein
MAQLISIAESRPSNMNGVAMLVFTGAYNDTLGAVQAPPGATSLAAVKFGS